MTKIRIMKSNVAAICMAVAIGMVSVSCDKVSPTGVLVGLRVSMTA